MKRLQACLTAALVMVAGVASAHDCPAGTKAGTQAPVQVKFVTADIDLFWRAYDLSTPDTIAAVLDREYLKKGSEGLAEFTRLRIGDSKQLAAGMQAHPKYYAALRAKSLKVASFQPAMRAAFQCLRDIYPGAVMPEVYFLIGRMNSAGTVDASKLLIGVDMFGKEDKGNKGDEGAMAELGRWHQAVVAPIERIPYIVAHELIHAQQDNAPSETLLAAALNEGVADFIGQLISGQTINPHLHEFARNRHAELWREFEKDMRGKDLSRWLYQGEKATAGWPADLGYYVGQRIAEAYYLQHRDNGGGARAIHDMLHIRDYEAFLRASGYAGNTTLIARE